MRTRYVVVIPAYREEKNIAAVVRSALRHCPEVLVVDDGSKDRTAEVADEAGALVIRSEQNLGKGSALNLGFQRLRDQGGEVVITLDADGQHDPDEIPKFIEAYERTGIPVLVGNRFWNPSGMPRIRWVVNRYMSWQLSKIMHQYLPDTQCGYRLYHADIIPFIATQSSRFAAESEILLYTAARGIRIDSVRIRTIYGREKSKINPLLDTLRFYLMLYRFHRRKGMGH